MDKSSSVSSACCPQRGEGITHLRIGTPGVVIGIMGLEAIFQYLYSQWLKPDEASDAELIRLVRQSNYVPNRPETEADYAVAIRSAYAAFFARK